MPVANLVSAGMSVYSIGTLDASISIPIPIIKYTDSSGESTNCIGPLIIQDSVSSYSGTNSARFLLPVIEGNLINVVEIWHTFGTSLPVLPSVTAKVDILGV